MNNEQFRRLAFDNPTPIRKSPNDNNNNHASSPTGRVAPLSVTQRALGSKARSSIPMTPRSVTSVNFARQLAEHRREAQGQVPPPTKKFKSSAAPRGTKLAAGYQDRTALRRRLEEEGEGDKEKRVRALEEAVRLGQIDEAMFERLKGEIGVGGGGGVGDGEGARLVKGLDWEELRRAKGQEGIGEGEGEGGEDEFERVLEEKEKEEVKPVEREVRVKKGTMAPPQQATGKRMTRDEILKQLKASRAAAAAKGGPPPVQPREEAPQSTLGSKFKKIQDANKKRWIETDENGRRKEILLVTDAEGKTKRKVRWLDKPVQQPADDGLLSVDKGAKPLGMEVPADILARMKAEEEEEDEDDDIFQGVGDDYNPLAGLEDSSSSSESEEKGEAKEPTKKSEPKPEKTEEVPRPTGPRNYFATGTISEEPTQSKDRSNPLTSDPTILAALKRAATIRKSSPSGNDVDDIDADEETNERRKKFLEEARRREMLDSMDLDMGFGGSRFGDEEDDEVWEERRGGNKRKRGPKKKKGDKDSVSDVMKVLEGRRKGDEKS